MAELNRKMTGWASLVVLAGLFALCTAAFAWTGDSGREYAPDDMDSPLYRHTLEQALDDMPRAEIDDKAVEEQSLLFRAAPPQTTAPNCPRPTASSRTCNKPTSRFGCRPTTNGCTVPTVSNCNKTVYGCGRRTTNNCSKKTVNPRSCPQTTAVNCGRPTATRQCSPRTTNSSCPQTTAINCR